MKEDKRIGRSLADLMSEHRLDEVLDGETIVEVNLAEIEPNPYQPRRIFNDDKIDELASSIKEHGVFQPIILKKVKDNNYIIVAGERRFRASKKIGFSKIPAIIRAYQEEKVAEIALVENLQREDLTAIEEANAYLNVMAHLKMTQAELAQRLGKSRTHITNIIGLLVLPETVQEMILKRQISMGHARALSKLDSSQRIEELARKIITEGLSVRAIEEATQTETKKINIVRRSKPVVYSQYEKKLLKQLGIKTKISETKIVFEFNDEELLKKIMDKLLND